MDFFLKKNKLNLRKKLHNPGYTYEGSNSDKKTTNLSVSGLYPPFTPLPPT